MATQVEICNLALIRIGQSKIANMGEDSKAAILLNDIWNLIVDEVLRDHTWNFAIRREQITAEVTAPAWGFTYEYLQPVDCLRVLGINDNLEISYRVEGLSIFTDEDSPINLKYIGRIEDTNQWDAKFVNTLAWRLAQEVAFPLAAGTKMIQLTHEAYIMALAEAKTVDSQENGSQDAGSAVWTDARG